MVRMVGFQMRWQCRVRACSTFVWWVSKDGSYGGFPNAVAVSG
jgi:hypothetical protein